MSRNHWKDAYCWHVQATYGPVDAARVPDVVDRWLVHCFEESNRPRLRVLLATAGDAGPASVGGTPVEPDSGRSPAHWPLIDIDDHAAHGAWMYNWFGSLTSRDSDEILLVVARNSLAINYSHKFGDEATIFPATRRLWLELSGRDPDAAPPLLPVDKRVGPARIVAAAAQLSITRPREAIATIRRLSRPTATGRIAREHGTAAPAESLTGGWLLFARIAAPATSRNGRLPSILFFTHLLAALDLPPQVQHSILTDLRPYSPLLAGRSGNAIGPISFTTDPATDDPGELAGRLGLRVRSGESLVRAAAGIVAAAVISARAGRDSRSGATVGAGLPTTSCSHVRLPAGQEIRDEQGNIPRTMGMMSPVARRLTVNTRETAGLSDMTFSYLGSEITVEQVRAALEVVQARLGTEIIAIDSSSYLRAVAQPAARRNESR